MNHAETIRQLIAHVRARWRAIHAMHAAVRAALACAGILALLLAVAPWTHGAPLALALVALAAAGLGLVALVWGLLPMRDLPGDRQVARFIEEREPSLEDRLVSAIEVSQSATPAGLAAAMLEDAARRTAGLDLDRILPSRALRRAGIQAAASVLALLALVVVSRHTIRQAYDATALTLFPARVALDVTPGNARLKAGSPLVLRARLVGNEAPVIAQLQIAVGDGWRAIEMTTESPGAFAQTLAAVSASFKYRVVAGTVTSPVYDIVVAHPPRVMRIDVDYTYPSGLRLPARTEHDSGDIYAPAGTAVRVHVVTDRPSAVGQMMLGDGHAVDLRAETPTQLSAALSVTDDNSYRIALTDREGFDSPGDTEYFIRVLEDRPPDVRILKPATDRAVTKLEEVDIEAQAEDDYGIDRLDLMYSVRGGPEQSVPLHIARGASAVNGKYTLALEDLDVQAGDFVSYYVRARDVTRGTRPNEARSDIFFLDVKPYEQEFALVQSQAASGAGGGGGVDDLVTAQKDIIVATWKLDRRAQAAKGAKSPQDILAVARAEAELKTRVEHESSTFRESTMRDPRRRPQPQRGGRGGPPPPEVPKAGQTLAEEDAMGVAAEAMTRAVAELDALKTGDARAPEMEALSALLKAQADVKKRDVQRQQAGSGAGNSRSNYDLSALFDKELRKAQQTNYENRSSTEKSDDAKQSELDKIKDLAQRQDELLKRQQDLARNREKLSEEDVRRALEQLTREQSELRQKAEDLARQMANPKSSSQQQPQQSQQAQQNGRSGQQGQQTPSGSPGQSQGQSQGQSGQSGANQSGQQMRDASEAMRSATNDLRRQDPNQAAASGSKALEKLRELERQMQSGQPDEQRRAMGEAQLEARQLADAERQIASELGKASPGDAGKDAVRRLAGEQERLAERARKLQDSLKQQGASASASKATAADAGRQIEQQRLADRMQQSADAMRAAAQGVARGSQPSSTTQRGSTAPSPQSDDARNQASAQQELAKALDRVAERLASATGTQDGESRKLSDRLARAQELREKIDGLTNQLKQAAPQNGRGGSSASATKSPGETGRAGVGQQGGGGGSAAELARLRDDYQRALQETRDLMEQMRKDDPAQQTFARGGAGFTFEGQGMTLSAPGTEAFKQDFAKWDDLRRQATQALEQAESTLSKQLQAKASKDRLAAGADDRAPADYQKQVDDYFKAIAKKKGG